MSEPAPPERFPKLFWWVVIGSFLSLGGGVTLLVLSQTGRLGANGGTGPGLPQEVYETGQRVDIWRNESWHSGSVATANGSHYRVHYDEATVFADETLDASRLREAKP